ncbi:hypothetical protein [Clostridium sp. ZBS18]|uniref:hypothetical protein n=1 Tax=Clostridium sp. ZBS18 TaxID=2949967 RepID=UPI00207A4B47|nr:hypothetical protein [Clostridium sp. ZBS18]
MNWLVKWFDKNLKCYDWEVAKASCGIEALRNVQKYRSIIFKPSDNFIVDETEMESTF